MSNSFGAQDTLTIGDKSCTIYRLSAVEKVHPQATQLPFALKILLENLLRHEDGKVVEKKDIEALANWDPKAKPSQEIAFTPARVLLQDFTGVPAIVDLAAMRDAMKTLGGEASKINPLQPVELVIDHSVQVDQFGTSTALAANSEIEYERNRERYMFLRWGQNAFANFRVVPPETGIVHQVNLEHLARVVFQDDASTLYPDTLVGTDSHTTMINGVGVLGWGVGGIEAEAAMLGQPISMLIPQVVGFKLTGKLAEGATATDLVLTVTQMLRERNVVGKFVEFYGTGLESLPLADRATIANMAPEYGATCGIFPIDEETLRYLRLTGRSAEHVARVEAYAKAQGLFRTVETPDAVYTDTLELDLGTVVPSLAGPKRPQDRVPLADIKSSFEQALPDLMAKAGSAPSALPLSGDGGGTAVATREATDLQTGSVVIAAITSCTNTSNPSVMLAAGLVAKKAAEKGLTRKPWVKTSLAPGSKAVTEYLQKADLLGPLEKLGFYLVGYGCTTCIGNSGPLPEEVSAKINEDHLVVASVLSGNRNFEGRVHAEVRANYLASPPLVVVYSLAGRIDFDPYNEPLGEDVDGNPVFMKDIWPTTAEINAVVQSAVQGEMFSKVYQDVFQGDERWSSLPVPEGDLYAWDEKSTYVKNPPYFEGMGRHPDSITDIKGARLLALLGDSITTDHISPAGSIKADSPAGKYLIENGVEPKDFNSYGSRRGNHEVMMRGTFANVRIRNKLAPGTEGGFTQHFPDGIETTIYDAAMQYKAEGVPLMVIAGEQYGTGSSRDWAAKGPRLLGIRAVIAQSYERIHRSNLVGMGVLPLQFHEGDGAESLGLTGEETFDVEGLPAMFAGAYQAGGSVTVKATAKDGSTKTFQALVRIDTPQEAEYYRHGGILQYVLRQLAAKGA
ncbi:MAG: aconitate hydratase AcnA [Gemmataceae bacterium]